MSTYNICFCGEIRKCQFFLAKKITLFKAMQSEEASMQADPCFLGCPQNTQ